MGSEKGRCEIAGPGDSGVLVVFIKVRTKYTNHKVNTEIMRPKLNTQI